LSTTISSIGYFSFGVNTPKSLGVAWGVGNKSDTLLYLAQISLCIHMTILVFIVIASLIYDWVVAVKNWRERFEPVQGRRVELVPIKSVDTHTNAQCGVCWFIFAATMLLPEVVNAFLDIISTLTITSFVVVFPGSVTSLDALPSRLP
jgi:hypothetical protein